jgi:hypothetical protein
MGSSTDYFSLRAGLHPDFAEVSDARLESFLASRNLDAESLEGFFDDLGKFASTAGKTILKAAPSILPAAGTLIGTAFGGPIGAQLGGTLGSLAGGAIGSATGAGAGGHAAPHAAGQLLQTILNPQTLQAIASMALGPIGKPNVSVGGTSVPVGAFTNLLGTLAGRAEAEYNESIAATRGNAPSYMLDYAGEAKGDPAVAQHRAEALFELLESAQPDAAESGESADSEAEALEAEYDALELLEMELADSEDL